VSECVSDCEYVFVSMCMCICVCVCVCVCIYACVCMYARFSKFLASLYRHKRAWRIYKKNI